MTANKITLRILSFNVWGDGQDQESRWPLIARAVAGLKPDFAGLQEVFRRERLDMVRVSGSYSNAFTPPHKTGLGLLAQGIIEEKNSFMLPFSPLEEYRRHIVFARIRFRDRFINLFNTHLSWKPEDEKSREVQADAVLGFVRSRQRADLDILTGDLNAVDSSPSVQKLLGYFKDTFRLVKPIDRGLTWSRRNKYVLRAPELPERRIDYILVGGSDVDRVKVLNSSVVFDEQVQGFWISDHFGMCTELEFV
ncbi:MAG: endonuclease/exonuclease/phosphatase family protein [Candidatus Omnitrophica bacterium]|nr:endonuclease/exonuclease/phosphatase family protein [Candidatus Omnitrophota bacterium]